MILGRLLVVAAAIAAPSLASAQMSAQVTNAQTGADAANSASAPVQESAGPRLSSERVGIAPIAATAEAVNAPPPPAQASMGQSVALMVVGGAALVTGLVIGGDAGTILALGGAVIGLVGLYQYLR